MSAENYENEITNTNSISISSIIANFRCIKENIIKLLKIHTPNIALGLQVCLRTAPAETKQIGRNILYQLQAINMKWNKHQSSSRVAFIAVMDIAKTDIPPLMKSLRMVVEYAADHPGTYSCIEDKTKAAREILNNINEC